MDMTVNELARRADATPHAVRYYTRIGLLRPGRNPENGYKLFHYDDVNRLRFIRRAKDVGFTLNEIADILDDAQHGKSPCPRARADQAADRGESPPPGRTRGSPGADGGRASRLGVHARRHAERPHGVPSHRVDRVDERRILSGASFPRGRGRPRLNCSGRATPRRRARWFRPGRQPDRGTPGMNGTNNGTPVFTSIVVVDLERSVGTLVQRDEVDRHRGTWGTAE